MSPNVDGGSRSAAASRRNDREANFPVTESERRAEGNPTGDQNPTPSGIVLSGPPLAPYTEKVRRALNLKSLDYELREPSGPEDYKRWSPDTGLLPVLEVDGDLISDSTEILLALDERFPDNPLLSSDPRTASQQRQLVDWADESFLWFYVRSQRLQEESAARADAPVSSWARVVGAWFKAGGTWERPEAALLRELGSRMDDLMNFLGSRPFFYSDRISMADLGVYGMLRVLYRDGIPGASLLLNHRPALISYMARVEEKTGGGDVVQPAS
jgi:glutathione S-transferase